MGGGEPAGLGTPDSAIGTKFDRGRVPFSDRLGGDIVRSMADAERAGGGMGVVPLGILGAEWPGEAVWARAGGAGGPEVVVASPPD